MRRLPSGLYPLLALIFLTLTPPRPLHAQEMPTESKGDELSVFAGFLTVRPDFYTDNDTGIAAGAAFTRFYSHLHVDPSIVLRGTYASGPVVTESTFTGGLQISRRFRRFHPYFDLLIGVGNISYAIDPAPGEHKDRGRALSFGGGLDIDIVHNIQARFDIQQQAWNLGKNPTLAPNAPNNLYTLSPTALVIGVNYVIPFRPHIGR